MNATLLRSSSRRLPCPAPGAGAVLALALAHACSGQVLWDESTVQGDLSNDRTVPTALTLAPGNNFIAATSGGGDRDYLKFTVSSGNVLTSLFLVFYSGSDGTAFLGLQRGSSITESPTSPVVGNLLGYAHFGTGAGNVGADLLPTIGTGAGAQGFTGSLAADTYSVWLQQLGSASTYQLNLVMAPVPEPAAVVPTVAGFLVLGAGVRAWRRVRGTSARNE